MLLWAGTILYSEVLQTTSVFPIRDSTIFVVYGDRYLCMFRRGNYDGFEQKTYDFSLGGKKGQTCLGVGYKDGRFFCLFEMGDMLIFSIDENETKMLLAATKPLLPEQLQRCDSLSVEAFVMAKKATYVNDRYHDHEVEEVMGFRLVTHWERDREESFLLVAVEENVLMATDLLLESSNSDDIKDNSRTTRVILVKDRLPLKRIVNKQYIDTLFFNFPILIWSFAFLFLFDKLVFCF
ncbi:unnamed protein product, partial [Linum tenue]